MSKKISISLYLCLILLDHYIGAWMAFTAIHLAFQHANLDYRLGSFKHLLGVVEIHRWHHKHGFGRKNLGEFWMIWDHLFGTYHYQDQPVKAEQIGLRTAMPAIYLKQLLWPFKAKTQYSNK